MEELNTNSQAATGAETPSESTTSTEAASTPAQQGGQVVEITDPDRYRYNGRSIKEWDSGYMRQQDYSTKTQALAQERKFYDNLDVDLERVKADPRLAEQFKQIYPEKFHAYLRYVMGETQRQPNAATQGQPTQPQFAQLDPRLQAKINQLVEGNRQAEVKAISAELDNIYKTMSAKYPYADEEAVTARAQVLFAKLKEQDPLNPNIRISEKQWEALWKSQHERSYGLADSQYKKQVKSQIEASRKGSDAGGGGGIPGTAPRQYKTIKEATAQALADIELGSFG
jgi:hypothetical protein